MGNEKNEKKGVEAEQRTSLWDEKSLFSKYDVWGDVVTSRWKCLTGTKMRDYRLGGRTRGWQRKGKGRVEN